MIHITLASRFRLILVAIFVVALALPVRLAAAQGATTYSATQTIPVPPASSYGGSGGGDGWGIALSGANVYNVFHHSSSLVVACHLQSDASSCWSPKTITDASGNNFGTSGQPGLWLSQSTGRLYVYATRMSDATGGVVCVDTTAASTTANPFCGFTALTAAGDAPPTGGISALSDPMLVGSRWYAFNYASESSITGTKNKLLCFDLTTFSACGSQPYTVNLGSGVIGNGDYPPPATAAIGNRMIIPATVDGTDELGCFDGSTLANCSGSWPVAPGFLYASSYGAPFPMMTSTGTINGFCLPTGSDPCFSLSGAMATTPANMPNVIQATSGWNGPGLVVGPRVYVPNGNRDEVECFDYGTDGSCANFPKSLPNLSLLYTVNSDPRRPTCVWVNSDNGGYQIQNFDAYTGGACGQGVIRVLASSMVVNTPLCTPSTYTSLQVLSPARTSYGSGTVAFADTDANPIAGTPTLPLDNTGTVSLAGLKLNTALGLPQFLITLTGAQGAPTSVTVKLTWTGVQDPSCVPSGQTSARLTLTPAAQTLSLGSLATITATLTSSSGAAVSNQKVDFVVLGANSRTYSAYTNANGVARFLYGGLFAGNDSITADVANSPGGTVVGTNAARVQWTPALSTLCTPYGVGQGYNIHCSIGAPFYIDDVVGCATDVGLKLLGDVAKAANHQDIAFSIEWFQRDMTAYSTLTAQTKLAKMLEAVNYLPYASCVTGLADLLTGGQYKALQMCLSETDGVCYGLLVQEFKRVFVPIAYSN